MAGYENRIVGYGQRAASEFVANPRNARVHPKVQREAVKGSLETLGWVAPVIVNARTGYLVDGHERLWQALAVGDDALVPYIEIDIDETEEAQFLVTFDYITTMAEYDRSVLDALIGSVETDNAAIRGLLEQMSAPVDDTVYTRKIKSPVYEPAGEKRRVSAMLPEHGLVMSKTVAKRRFIDAMQHQTLESVLPELPDPDTDVWIVSNGRGALNYAGKERHYYELGNFIIYILEKLQKDSMPVECYIATWRISQRHVDTLKAMIECDLIQRLVFLTDVSIVNHSPSTRHGLMQLLKAPHVYVECYTHAKIFAASNGQRAVLMTGSANLSSQPRCENYHLTTDVGAYEFFVQNFFEPLVREYGGGSE